MQPEIYKAVIAAGGKGTRLRTINGDIPKALTPINGGTILRYQIIQLIKYGVKEIHLLLGFKSEELIKYVENECLFQGVEFKFHTELSPCGSGGALLLHKKQLPNQYFYIYCDIFFDINLDAFRLNHMANNACVSLLVHPNDHPHDSDLIEVDSNNRVIGIHAHPHNANEFPGNLVNAAIYLVNNEVLDMVNKSKGILDFAQDILPQIVSLTNNVYAYKSWEYAKDIGTPKRLNSASLINSNFTATKTQKSVIFLDRDGTINEIVEGEYIKEPNQIKLIEGAAEAIKTLRAKGYYIIIITNQPVIARGDLNAVKLKKIHDRIEWELGIKGAFVDEIYYCPHHPDSGFKGEIQKYKIKCCCRKPGTELLDLANTYLPIDLASSWFVGDMESDVDCGIAYGLNTCFLTKGKNFYSKQATINKSSLKEYSDYLIKLKE